LYALEFWRDLEFFKKNTTNDTARCGAAKLGGSTRDAGIDFKLSLLEWAGPLREILRRRDGILLEFYIRHSYFYTRHFTNHSGIFTPRPPRGGGKLRLAFRPIPSIHPSFHPNSQSNFLPFGRLLFFWLTTEFCEREMVMV
jgi:hypothetical protein